MCYLRMILKFACSRLLINHKRFPIIWEPLPLNGDM